MITMKQALEYEVSSSRWARFIFIPFLQELAGSYFAWKIKRKYKRYQHHQSSKIRQGEV